MAKKATHVQLPAQQDEEMVVTVVRFRGSGESLRKGIDALTQAFNGAFSTQPERQIGNGRSPAPRHLDAPNAKLPEADNPEMSDEGVDGPELQQNSVPPRGKKSPKTQYVFIDDFNLAPAGKTSWNDHVAAHGNPDGVEERFLVASAWAQTHGGVDPFTGGHLFTLFRTQKWPTQADMTQPLRKMKARKSYYDNPEHGKWRLTSLGLSDSEKIGKS